MNIPNSDGQPNGGTPQGDGGQQPTTGGAAPGSGGQGGSTDGGRAPGSDTGGNNQLQQNMKGDFFDDQPFYDDGMDAVVDHLGNPIRDADGNVVRTMEELEKLGLNTGKPAKKPDGKPAAGNNDGKGDEVQPKGFDSVFTKDGNFDVESVIKTSSGMKDYSYQMRSSYNTAAGNDGKPVDPKEKIRTSVDEFRTNITTQRQEPIKKIFDGVQQAYARAGQDLPKEVYDVINGIYLENENSIRDEVEKRRDELIGEILTEKTTEAEMKAAKEKSTANFRSVAQQLIPNVPKEQQEERLSELVFGYQGDDGKFVSGYGADIISALFDASVQNKTFSTQDEWKAAYNNWWYQYSSDPKNVQLIANIAFSRYVAANHSKYRDEYRRAWENELAGKNKNRMRQTRAGGPGGQPASNSLLDYHRGPGRNQ